jgi:hypothetical protein
MSIDDGIAKILQILFPFSATKSTIRTYLSYVFRPDSKEDRTAGEKKRSQIRPGLRNPPEVTQCSASGFNPRATKGKPIPYVEKSAGKSKHSRDESNRRCLPVAEVRRAVQHHLPELLPHQNHHRKDHHLSHHEDQHDEHSRAGRGDKMAGSAADRRHVANSCSSADTDQLTAAASNGLQGRNVSTPEICMFAVSFF